MSSLNCSGDEKHEGRRGICNVWQGFGPAIYKNAFSHLKVSSVALGQNHGLLLTVDRKVCSFGTGPALGNGAVVKNSCLPTPVGDLLNKNVVQVACGPDQSAAVCDDGSLYMWGENSEGQCGQPIEQTLVLTPILVKIKDYTHTCKLRDSVIWYKVKIQEVSCGKNHSLALSLSGDLWSWGSLLGVVTAPHKLQSSALSERKILSICCGLRHNIAIVRVISKGEPKVLNQTPTLENSNEPINANALTGCSVCDIIESSKEFSASDLVEERNCCPFGLSLEDGGSNAVLSTTPPKSPFKRHAKNKKVKELVNAAVGAGKEVTLNSDGEIVNEIIFENTGESTLVNVVAESNANLTENLNGDVKENCGNENIGVYSECNLETVVGQSVNGQTECNNVDESLARSRLSITESFRQGVGYLSVQSVQNFLSRQFSSSKCDSEIIDSSLPETATVQENKIDAVDSKTSSQTLISAPQTVTENAHSSISSPLDQFSFVFNDNWQSIEMTTYNSAAVDELQATARSSNSLMSLNIDTRKHLDHVDLSPKGSSCERVNDIKDSSTLDFELRLGSKSDSNNSLDNSWNKCDILSWGNGFEGQLGHGDSLNRDEPIRIRSLIDYEVIKIVSGHLHCLLLTACGQVYGWGSNSHGQLGLSSSEHPIILSPQLIKIPDNAFVWDIGAGGKSSIFLVNRFGEQQLYICGKREGQLNETSSIKTESLTIHNVQTENCKISQIFGGGSYFSCVMDQVTGGHLGVLYELTNTELSFFSFLNKLATTALTPILQNESLINSCGLTLQQLFESFIEISLNSARNGHRLRYIIQKADRKESRPLFHDLEQQLSLYRKYCKHYCDALAINGFGIAVKTASSVFKIASKVLMEMSNSVDVKIAMAPETLQHLMEEPIRRMNQYKKLFFNLAQQRKQKNWCSFWESQAAEKWDKSIAWVAIEKQEAERTRAFWDIYPNKVADALKKPGRRIIRDSKVHSVSLFNSGRFSTHWFILFNDILAHYHFSGLEKYDLSVTWVDPSTGLEGKSNAFTLTFPEETLVLICDTSAEKTEWVSAINNAIDRKLKLKMNGNASDFQLASSRAATTRCNPPLVRHATYTFGKSSLYKDATYSGMWICGQLQGHGELSWGDGRQYVGQFKQNNQDGFGTYIVDSAFGQTIYRGTWRNGKLNGLGNIKYPNGDSYEGYFKDKVRHGHGVLKCGRFVMSAASIYIGQWVNDKKEGYGVMDDIERGEKYIGFWLDDLPHGKGILVTLDGIYFEGSFVKGQMGGTGLVYDDGGWYEGEVGAGHTFNGKGVLTLASGDSIEGHFSGYWNDNIKLTGTLKRSNKRKLLTEIIFPNSFTKLSVPADEKWTDIFYHCYEMLGMNESSGDALRKAWDSVAVILSNWKKSHWKKPSSKSIQANDDMSILERIPIEDTTNLTFEKYVDIKNYLYKAFETPYHPLGRLIDGLVDVFRASYVGTGAHLCLLQHAVEEVRSYLYRINIVVRILFPCLPAAGDQVAFNMNETNESQDLDAESTIEIVTSESLLLPILLPKIHPPLFTLYALRHEIDDNIYWETLMKWNKQTDIALMAFLGVDQQFWTSVDAGYLVDKRASMSTIRDCNYTKAIDTLQQLSTTFSPIEKLQVVQKAFEEINNEVQGRISSTYMWTMDDLFPVFEYVVVRAGIRHLGSEIHMMDDLMEKRFQNGELGIMFTMLRACYFQVKNERCLSM